MDIYATGVYFSDSILYDSAGRQIQLPSETGNDAFLIKFDKNGVFKWYAYLGPNTLFGYFVTTDSTSVYVSGTFSGGNIRDSSGTQIPLTIESPLDALLIKFDSKGIYQWYAYLGDEVNRFQAGFRCTTDTNNVYIVGAFTGGSINDSSGNQVTLPTNEDEGDYTPTDAFLIKFDKNGIYQWHTRVGLSNNVALDVVADETDVYITCGTNGGFIYDSNNDEYTIPSGTNGMIIKFNTNGIYQWYVFAGIEQSDISIIGFTLAIDSNNIYITGNFSGAIYDNAENVIDLPTGSSFLIKFNKNGLYQWYTYFDQTNNFPTNLIADGNNVYIVGGFTGGNIHDSADTQIALSSNIGGDGYLVKFNTNGIYQWYAYLGGNGENDSDITYGIALDTNYVYIVGQYSEGTLYDSAENEIPLTTGGAFLIKFDTTGIYQWMNVGTYANYNDVSTQVPVVSDICFPAKTPIQTDQGQINIDELDNQTIQGKSFIVTKTISTEDYLICFEKHALGFNYPNKRTIMSPEHHLLFRRQFIKAKDLLHFKSVKKVPYDGEILYNILFKTYRTVIVNNLVCESLHPKSKVAALYQDEPIEVTPTMYRALHQMIFKSSR